MTDKPTFRGQTSFLVNFGRVTGAVGTVLFASSPLTFILAPWLSSFLIAKLVVGTLGIAFYLATNRDFFARLRGARSGGLWALSVGTTAVVLALVGSVNVFVAKHPREFDLTREQVFTLSEQTEQVLRQLSEPVVVTAYYANFDFSYTVVEENLKRYARLSPHFQFRMVDPQTDPVGTRKYNITKEGPRIIFTRGSLEARVKEPTEESLTHALLKVSGSGHKRIAFLKGHGEGNLSDSSSAEGFGHFAEAVRREGYDVVNLNLLEGASGATRANLKKAAPTIEAPTAEADETDALTVPDDAAVLVLLAPEHALLAPEVGALESFLARGGRLLALIEPRTSPGLEALFAHYGIELRDDLIVDTSPVGKLLGLGPASPLVQPLDKPHDIVKKLEAPVIMTTARSVGRAQAPDAPMETTGLLQTQDTAWGETHVGTDGSVERDDRDNLPPLWVGAVTTHTAAPEAKQTRLVVFGDADFVNNRYLGMQGNHDCALNALAYLAEEEGKLTIRPRSRHSSQLFLNEVDLGRLKFFSMDIVPVLIIACGLGIVLMRRQR